MVLGRTTKMTEEEFNRELFLIQTAAADVNRRLMKLIEKREIRKENEDEDAKMDNEN